MSDADKEWEEMIDGYERIFKNSIGVEGDIVKLASHCKELRDTISALLKSWPQEPYWWEKFIPVEDALKKTPRDYDGQKEST